MIGPLFLFFSLVSGPVHTVHLTFDDGPNAKYTPQVLSILKEENVKATFFLVGQRCLANPELEEKISKEGHRLGGHSWTHANLTQLSLDTAEIDIVSSMVIVNLAQETNLFRFPYGASNRQLKEILKQYEFKSIGWDVDTLDWKQGEDAYKNFVEGMKTAPDHAIILMHDKSEETLKALPKIIHWLKAKDIKIELLK